jgi:uncharacterized protein (DUF488 family)
VTMRLLTVGHSNHTAEHFLKLLAANRVEVISDVRSWPHSRYAEWAGADELRTLLRAAGIRYVFLGDELGGRPDNDDAYNAAGHVVYGRVASSDAFQEGLERLKRGLSGFRVAVMCSEENPEHCHRRLLIVKVLMEQGVEVDHIRGDGRIEHELGVRVPEGQLFANEDDWWISTQSVSRRRRPATSSAA